MGVNLIVYIYICRLMGPWRLGVSQPIRFSKQTLTLFAVLMEQPRDWRHGYDLSKDTGLKSGTLYPILMRLGDRGLLESKWEAPSELGRPPRHMYRLTAIGVALANEWLAANSNWRAAAGHT